MQQVEAPARDFSMRVMPESFAAGGSAGFSFTVEERTDSALLSISVDEASALSHAYLEITYDNTQWTPGNAQSAGLLGEDSISLLAGNGRGLVQYGELQPGTDTEGMNGSGLLATIEFRAEAEQPRSASADHREAPLITRNANWDILSWYYENTGDYDQNGEVNIADLTPLGVNLSAVGPFDIASARYMVDGDGNGEINLADITPIAVHFGNRVEGYEIFAGQDGAGFPADPFADNGIAARSLASLDLANAQGGGSERKYFIFGDSSVQLHDRYWVRMHYGEPQSVASELTPAWQKDWQRNLVFSNIKKPSGIAPRLAEVDGRPCVLYVGGNDVDGAALFMGAENAIGMGSWSLPVNVSGAHIETDFLQLMEHDGRPAIAFGSTLSGASVYREALNSAGDLWDDPVSIIGGGFFPQDLFLFEGQPAVVGCDGNQALISIISEDGSFFSGYALGLMSDVSAVPRSNAVEICYRNGISSHHARLAFDGFVFDYTSSTPLAMDFNQDECTDTFDYDGKINMLLFDDLLHRYEFVQGEGGDSGIFTAPLSFLEGGVEGAVVCESLGRIWAAYLNIDTGTIRCRMSDDGDLSVMSQLPDLDNLTDSKFHPAIAEVRRHPAVFYVDETDSAYEFIMARYI